jgi:hypothetical protein
MSRSWNARVGRAVAALYPREASLNRDELAAFVSASLAEAHQRRRRVRALASLTADLGADLLKMWLGRSALPI